MKPKFDAPLTSDNAQEVLNHFERALKDHEFSMVSAHEDRGFRPEAQTKQRLEGERHGNNLTFTVHADNSVTFWLHYSDGLLVLSSDHREDDTWTARVTVDQGMILVSHYNDCGSRMYWMFLFEENRA